MSLVFSSSFVRLYSDLIEYSSLYSFGSLFYLNNFHAYLSRYMLRKIDMVDLPKSYSGIGLVFIHMIALYSYRGYRVAFSNVSVVLRLVNAIKWVFTPQCRRDWLPLVTAQDRCALTFAFRSMGSSWNGCSSASGASCMAMTGCCKELGSPGWFRDIPRGHC